jgi:hypothetical protein
LARWSVEEFLSGRKNIFCIFDKVNLGFFRDLGVEFGVTAGLKWSKWVKMVQKSVKRSKEFK